MQAVERTLHVLSSVAAQSGSITLAELSKVTDLSMSTLHRYVHRLIELGHLRSGPGKELSIGPATMALGAAALSSDSTASLISSVLGELSRGTGATSFVGRLVGNEVICTAMQEGANPLHLTVRIGQVIPVHQAAAARSLLAFASPAAVASVWDHSGGRPGAEFREFQGYLDRVRRDGFDVCDSELDEGVWAVAAPIRNEVTGSLYGSVAVAGPASLFATEESRTETIGRVILAASELSVTAI